MISGVLGQFWTRRVCSQASALHSLSSPHPVPRESLKAASIVSFSVLLYDPLLACTRANAPSPLIDSLLRLSPPRPPLTCKRKCWRSLRKTGKTNNESCRSLPANDLASRCVIISVKMSYLDTMPHFAHEFMVVLRCIALNCTKRLIINLKIRLVVQATQQTFLFNY